jgi:hypothetical protein
MGAVQRIAEKLQRYPELAYQIATSTIAIDPPTADGFRVSLTEGAGEWVVGFDGWHEHFTSEEEALNCFSFGLSDRCRLRVHYRGSLPYRWTVEESTDGGWRECSTTGLLSFRFWRRIRIKYLQNTVIRSADLSLSESEPEAPARAGFPDPREVPPR